MARAIRRKIRFVAAVTVWQPIFLGERRIQCELVRQAASRDSTPRQQVIQAALVLINCSRMEWQIFFFLLHVAAIVIALVIWTRTVSARRRKAMSAAADSLNLIFDPAKNDALERRYPFLRKLGRPSNQNVAFNMLSGSYRGHAVSVFDYKYAAAKTSNDFSFFVLHLPGKFPELVIVPETGLSKMAQLAGYDDIDFESAEFSRAFCVRSPDKRFGYDVCHPGLTEYLLKNRDIHLRIEEFCLTLCFSEHIATSKIRMNLDRLVRIRELLPQYLMSR